MTKNIAVESLEMDIHTRKGHTYTIENGKEIAVDGVRHMPKKDKPSEQINTRPASEAQTTKYMELCVQKGIIPADVKSMTSQQASQAIEGLIEFYPASSKQKQMVRDLIAELRGYGANIKELSEYKLSRLSGGRDGKASALINQLRSIRATYMDKVPPSEAQILLLVEMMYCPDAPFGDFGIEYRVSLKDSVGEGMWRLKTPQEFAHDIKTHMTHAQASKFIDDVRVKFYEWKKTRITEGQKSLIRNQEKRMMNTSKSRTHEFAIDDEGNIVELAVPSAREAVSVTGYNPMTEEQINMLSVEEASKLIEQMNYELRRMSRDSYADNEPVHFEDIRYKTSEKANQIKEFEDLNNMLYAVQAVAGVEIEKFQNEIARLIQESPDNEQVKKIKDEISEFVFMLIKEDYISFHGMVDMIDRSPLAEEVIMSKFK